MLAAALESAPTFDGPSLDELRAAFPQLEISECIGRGAMGIVYKARQPHLDRLVALKILAPNLSSDPAFPERFSREARALAKLSHPNIVGIHDFGESGGFYYLLMEYVDGVNLRQAMSASRFTAAQALSVIPKLCSAIQFAHDHDILHRDIKPENILLDTAGRIKIADFGIARLIGDTPDQLNLTATGSALGSGAYMAPEQIEDPRNIDHRADIYSLGVVFYEMLTGGLPLGRFPVPSEISDTDPGLDDIVLRALENQRERRYQRADEIETDLGNPRGARASRPLHTASPAAVSDPSSHKLFLWSLGLIIGGLITGTMGSFTSPVLVGLGATAFTFGQIGGWSMLVRMKQGKFPLTWRKLLLALSFIPTLTGLIWLIVITPLLSGASDLRFGGSGFEDLIYSDAAMPLLWVLLPFIVAVSVGRLLWKLVALPGSTVPSRSLSRFKIFAPIAGPLLLLVSLLAAKHLKEQLQLFSKYAGTSLTIRKAETFRTLNDEDAAVVKEAAMQAAGDYADFYRIEFPPEFQKLAPRGTKNALGSGTMSLDFICDIPFAEERSQEHFTAFEQRFRALLPASFFIERGNRSIHEREIQSEHRTVRGVFGLVMAWSLVASSILTIFSDRKIFIVSMIGGLLVIVALSQIDSWPTPRSLPPAKPYRSPLPELAPILDRSTPRATVESMIRAAQQGDLSAFTKSFSASYFNLQQDPDAHFDSNDLKVSAPIEILRVEQVDPFNATVAARASSSEGWVTRMLRLRLEEKQWLISEVEMTPEP